MIFSKPEHDSSEVVPFAKCPACRQLIRLEIVKDIVLTNGRNCSFCYAQIEREEIEASCAAYVQMTKALHAAADVVGFKVALSIIFGLIIFEMTLIAFIDDKFSFFNLFIFTLSVAFLVSGYQGCENWLGRFGRLKITDEEFISIKKTIKRGRLIWTFAFILNLILWFLFTWLLSSNIF